MQKYNYATKLPNETFIKDNDDSNYYEWLVTNSGL